MGAFHLVVFGFGAHICLMCTPGSLRGLGSESKLRMQWLGELSLVWSLAVIVTGTGVEPLRRTARCWEPGQSDASCVGPGWLGRRADLEVTSGELVVGIHLPWTFRPQHIGWNTQGGIYRPVSQK